MQPLIYIHICFSQNYQYTQATINQAVRNYNPLLNLFKQLHKIFKNNTNHIKPEKLIAVVPWEFELGTDQQGQEKSWHAK